MTLFLVLACRFATDDVDEVKEAEIQVTETIESISEMIANNEAELDRITKQLEDAKQVNASAGSEKGVYFETCPSACAGWRQGSPDVPSRAVRYFKAYAYQNTMRCGDADSSKCHTTCNALCEMLRNDGLDLPFTDFKSTENGAKGTQ